MQKIKEVQKEKLQKKKIHQTKGKIVEENEKSGSEPPEPLHGLPRALFNLQQFFYL